MSETEKLIRNITDAAVGLINGAAHQPLLDAIDKFGSHCYAEGRADQMEDYIAALTRAITPPPCAIDAAWPRCRPNQED